MASEMIKAALKAEAAAAQLKKAHSLKRIKCLKMQKSSAMQ